MEPVLFLRQGKNKRVRSRQVNDLTPIITSGQFLANQKRQDLLDKLRQYSCLESARYDSVCSSLIKQLVHYAQQLPESVNSYYAQAGGLVDFALHRTEAALSLFQEFIIADQQKSLSEEQSLWQYALFSAALLQGIGKLFIDYRVHLFDEKGQPLKQWNPLLDSLVATGSYYDYEFLKESDIELRRRLNLLLAQKLMPPSGFSWIAANPQVLTVWLALLNEDLKGAGTLGALLIRAQALAISRYFAEFIARSGMGRGSVLGRTGTFSGGLPEHVNDKEQAIGIELVQWLMSALEKGLIVINKAPLLMVPGGFVMCPEIYQLFVREHPEYKNWQAIQKAFLSLGLHRVYAESPSAQSSNQDSLNRIVFTEYALALPASVKVYQANTDSVQTCSALELIHSMQEHSSIIAQGRWAAAPLHQLTVTGQWQIASSKPSVAPGALYRG